MPCIHKRCGTKINHSAGEMFAGCVDLAVLYFSRADVMLNKSVCHKTDLCSMISRELTAILMKISVQNLLITKSWIGTMPMLRMNYDEME